MNHKSLDGISMTRISFSSSDVLKCSPKRQKRAFHAGVNILLFRDGTGALRNAQTLV